MTFSPDGNTIASGSAYNDNTVRLWDAHTQKPKKDLRVRGTVYSIVFSPDGNTIAAGTSNGVYLADAATGRQKTMLTGHKNSVEAVAYSPDGKTLASVSLDGTMLLWDLAENLKVQPVQLVGDFNSDGVVNFSDMVTAFFNFIANLVTVMKGVEKAAEVR